MISGKFYATEHAVVASPAKSSSPKWLYYQLTHLNLNKYATGVAQPGLSVQVLEQVISPFPPLPEQKTIAEVLSVWDRAIEKTERLIKAKQKRFKGLLQTLINPPEKTGWEKTPFSRIFKRHHVQNTENSEHEVLSVTTAGIVRQADYFNKEIASIDRSKYLLVERGTFVMSGLNFWMGSVDFQKICDIGMVSPAYKVFKLTCGDVHPAYMHLYVRSPQMKRLLDQASIQGASIVRRNLDMDALNNSDILLPPLSEQKCITETLNLAQREIDLLKKLAEKQKLQKRGLMQKLLTGEWQVNFSDRIAG